MSEDGGHERCKIASSHLKLLQQHFKTMTEFTDHKFLGGSRKKYSSESSEETHIKDQEDGELEILEWAVLESSENDGSGSAPLTFLVGPTDASKHDIAAVEEESHTSNPSHIIVGSSAVAIAGGTTLTAVTLDDGTHAFVAQQQGSVDAEGESLQLQDGNTLLVPELPHLIQLGDGTTALMQAPKAEDDYRPLGLEEGTATYIALPGSVLEPLKIEGLTSLTNGSQQELQMSCESSEHIKIKGDEESELCVRDKAKNFKCPHEGCGKFYTTLHHLKVHERSHTGDRPFRCTESGCDKAFATGYGRKAHVRTHTGEKPYKCPEETCNKCFKTSGDLQKHVRTHTGERPFVCPVPGCGRSFTTSNIRKVHVRTHTGERPYVCPEEGCDRAFASATNYKNHLRIHSGEKPYVCTVQGCNKRFTEYSSLYKHHMVHTQQKPYYCTVCARHYRQASTLAMHKRTAHGIVEADDGTEIILGETMFALANAAASGGARRLKNLGSNILGLKDGNTLVALQSTGEGGPHVPPGQFLVVTDPTQLAALEEMGITAQETVIEDSEDLEMGEDGSSDGNTASTL